MREYLSEEELEKLIAQLEKQELYAPENLKAEILDRAFPAKQPEPSALFSYRLKIIAGMAAALAMLALIPMQDKGGRLTPKWNDVSQIASMHGAPDSSQTVSMQVALKESSQRAQQNMSGFLERLQEIVNQEFIS